MCAKVFLKSNATDNMVNKQTQTNKTLTVLHSLQG